MLVKSSPADKLLVLTWSVVVNYFVIVYRSDGIVHRFDEIGEHRVRNYHADDHKHDVDERHTGVDTSLPEWILRNDDRLLVFQDAALFCRRVSRAFRRLAAPTRTTRLEERLADIETLSTPVRAAFTRLNLL